MSSRALPLTVLLPPSEGKAPGGDGAAWSPDDGSYGSTMGPHRAAVAHALRSAGGGDAKLLGVRGPLLDRALEANRWLEGSPTLPAWHRYTGVVWDHLDPATLQSSTRRRIVVVSGLLGLVRADDPTPDYRLKMGARLAPLGTLAGWWRPRLATPLRGLARRRTVVDLLPIEHRAALEPDPRRLEVTLRTRDGRSGGHAAKAAKGRLARHLLLTCTGDDPSGVLDALGGWHDDEFTLDIASGR